MKILIGDEFYKTTDMVLTSTLNCLGYLVETIDKQNPTKVIFLIRKDKQLDDIIQKYFTQKLQVEPTAFANNIKILKNRIYNS